MPTYNYLCPKCDNKFEDIRSISASSEIDCPKCANQCDDNNYDWSKFKVYIKGASVQSAEYNPGLGQVVKNEHHKKEIMKQKNLVEVGNDFGSGEKMQKDFEKKRVEERERIWNTEPKNCAGESV